jgi:hypothetical protein
MDTALIPIPTDVLAQLLALRADSSESLACVIHRIAEAYSSLRAQPKKTTIRDPNSTDTSGPVRYSIRGVNHTALDATEAMISILAHLGRDNHQFFEALAGKVRGRTRHHVARTRAGVYPERPDLERHVKQIGYGWFVGSNIANREKAKILREACKLSGLTFGRDVQIRWSPNGRANP